MCGFQLRVLYWCVVRVVLPPADGATHYKIKASVETMICSAACHVVHVLTLTSLRMQEQGGDQQEPKYLLFLLESQQPGPHP